MTDTIDENEFTPEDMAVLKQLILDGGYIVNDLYVKHGNLRGAAIMDSGKLHYEISFELQMPEPQGDITPLQFGELMKVAMNESVLRAVQSYQSLGILKDY